VPVLAVLLLPIYVEKPKIFLKSLGLGAALVLLIIAPFLLSGEFSNLWRVLTGAVGSYPYISLHAFNFWQLMFPGKDLVWVTDASLVFGITLRNAGLILYLASLVLSLFPLARFVKKQGAARMETYGTRDFASWVFLSTGLICLDFFFFNTQMHERYIHPAILFFGLSALLSGSYFSFVTISLAYFLSLDLLIQRMKFPEAVYALPGLFNPLTIAILYLLTLVTGLYRLYWKTAR
jgi:hypothetical protein